MNITEHEPNSFLAGYLACDGNYKKIVDEARRQRKNVVVALRDQGAFHFRTTVMKAEQAMMYRAPEMSNLDIALMAAAFVLAMLAFFMVWAS